MRLYGLVSAMDGNETAPGVLGSRRNPFITGEDRLKISVMDSGPVQISGISVNTEGEEGTYRMQGRFWQSMDMALGHVRTDEQGQWDDRRDTPERGLAERGGSDPDNPHA